MPLLEVQITPAGRKAVRAASGELRTPRMPKGQLRERQWAALARLYVVGEAGESSEAMLYGRGGFDWTRTLLRLRDYTPQPLMEEFHDPQNQLHARMRLTSFGRAYYQNEWARYRELYPNVDAPEPARAMHAGD